MEVAPGVHLFKVPIPGVASGYLNAYLIKTHAGCLLVDTGWNTDEAYAALAGHMAEAGVSFGDLREIVITHVHPDHWGLVGRLKHLTQARLVIHERERAILEPRYLDYDTLLVQMDEWLRVNGVPADARPDIGRASMAVLGLVAVAMPDWAVRGGEHLALDPFDFEILWTPGHSPGHICLYDAHQRLLISGDHVLPDQTPNVSMHIQSGNNPLQDYLDALARVAPLPVDLVLPSHGAPFSDLQGRVAEIRQHHEDRMATMLAAFDGGERTGAEIAAAIRWTSRGVAWDTLRPLDRRMAVTETLAHLELLRARQRVQRAMRDGLYYYALTGR